MASPAGSKKKVRVVLQESGPESQERPRRVASALEQSNHHKRASTMRSAHDTQPLSDDVSSGRATLRSGEIVHTTVPETVRRHKSNDGTVSSRTVTRYDATLPEAELDSAVEQSQPNILERDSTNVRVGNDIFVAHKWSKTDKPVSDKRTKTPRNLTNVSTSTLGNIYAAVETDASEMDVFPEKDKQSAQGEEARETYKEAVKDPTWRESMINEIRALRNQGC